MSRLFLLLGGNLGDKKKLFKEALFKLEENLGKVTDTSSIYETEPWGFRSDDLFWNQVVVLETKISPDQVLAETKKIEMELGRVRKEDRYSSRLMDIDILFYDDLILSDPELEIPHPRICERRFVLEPLAETAPDLQHPVFKKSISELLANCPDKLVVTKLDVVL